MHRPNRPTLLALIAVFARHGNFTFGGGSATAVSLHRETVERRQWIEQTSFDLAYSLSRLTPGTNLFAFSTALGWMVYRWPGAISALVAGSLPCAGLATLMTALYKVWSRNPMVQVGVQGALASAVAVMFITGVIIIRPHWQTTSWIKLLVFVGGSFVASIFFSVSPIQVLCFAVVIGFLWPSAEKTA